MIVKRYNPSDVALVPLWEWRWLKQIEAGIRAGEFDVSGFLRNLEEAGRVAFIRGIRKIRWSYRSSADRPSAIGMASQAP